MRLKWSIQVLISTAIILGAVGVEASEASRQFPDGRIIFTALDAQIHGQTAKLESVDGNHHVGSWTSAEDYLSWRYEATRPGLYAVELVYALTEGQGSTVAIQYAGQQITAMIELTPNHGGYATAKLGKLYVAKPGKVTLNIKCLKKTGPECMNLKSISLLPTAEGSPVRQAADGVVTCHARDVTIHGVKVQYEPRPIKNTVGYWIVPTDWVSWEFTLQRPGSFTVEILQGCGKGQGGSQVELSVDGQPLRFVIEDTGHFQNFKPRVIGKVRLTEAGVYRLSVKPINIAAKAVMDLRQVRLIPTEDP